MDDSKVKRPASQYYWGEFLNDKALQSCGLMARGLWHEMNCLMHQGEPYGHLTVNGKAMTIQKLANLCRITAGKCKALVDELEDAGVFSRDTTTGAIYSRRMVRDEAVRESRAQAGRDNGIKGKEFGALGGEHGAKGGRPRKDETPPETPPTEPGQKPPQNPHPSSSSASSSASSSSVVADLLPLEEQAVVGGAAQTPAPPPPPFRGEANAKAIPKGAVVPLAGDWELPETWGTDAEALGFSPSEILRESEKFRQYWVSGKGAGTRRKLIGWRQSWSNWLAKAEPHRRTS